ncbi:hypothetical protein DER45DRAFT_578932 [Fusarium avenaceum]|nr:hypothetical protein DER45DRAFT_578932 [Fusarium avenaceum]
MCSDTNLNSGIQDLLVDTAVTVIEVAKVAYLNAANQEVKAFYCHLGYNCFRLQDSLTRARHGSIQIDNHYVNQAISSLGLLIPETDLQELPAHHVTLEFRLKSINLLWKETRTESESSKSKFVQRWLRQDITEEQRNEVDKTLERSADVFETSQPEQPLRKSATKLATLKAIEPPFAVGEAANSVFDALIACKNCSCHPQHGFKAKLELGTYRTPEKSTAHHKPVRRNHTDDDLNAIELEVFLSMERDWHEFRVQTVKKRLVHFKDAAETASRRRREVQMKKIDMLCKPIIKTRGRPLQRLLIRLKSGELFEVQPEKSSFHIDKCTRPISLLRCLEDKKDLFTEKTKRVLSLIIGYTVLHLSSTPWLRPGWGSSSIKFFRTMACKTPLRPFIEVPLQKEDTHETLDDDGELTDDLNSGHRCPELVALAVVLMEIYFARPFSQLAAMHNVSLIPTESGLITLMDVDQVFWGDGEGEEGWRAQIPEDSPLLEVIDNCLDGRLWEDTEGEPLGAEELRSRIYREVVWPLELHLTQGFSQIHLDGVDQYAKNLNFEKWGQEIVAPETDNQLLLPSSGHTKRGNIPPSIPLPQTLNISTDFPNSTQLLSQLPPVISYTLSDVSLKLNSDACCGAPQFFDDQAEASAAGADKYRTWRTEYTHVYRRFLGKFSKGLPSKPVKVAILDTGIDRDHPLLEAREDNLSDKKNFYDSTQKNVSDTHGHGTFAASLLLDYAPDVSLHIAKIADKNNMTPDLKHVVDAIYHAIDKWGVDIISMSFGWPSSDVPGYNMMEDAIEYAYSEKVLMFAAASNSGARLGRAYPASNSQVICVHSTDTYGVASSFSPTAEPNAINLATIGESVESAWPIRLCNDSGCLRTRSGTSYSTPIMAGIAAFLLQYARTHLPASEALMLKRKDKMEALLKRCAIRGPNYKPRDGYFYVHLSLHKHNLFGGDLEWINTEIARALKS